MLEGILPGFCSRLRIFLSYASEHRRIAEELAQTLKNSGHVVFYDKDSLPPGDDYNEQIRKGIRSADRFVFLVSRSALEPGRFTLSELQFAKERWPAPAGRVLPVLLDKTIKPEELPIYLRSVQALSIAGNPTAEIASEIDKTRRVRGGWLAGLAAVLIACAGFAAAAAWPRLFPVKAEVAFTPPAKIDLRPLVAPPEAGGAADAWLKGDVALTAIRFLYEHRSASGAPAQIRDEQVELRIDGTAVPFEYRYEVNIMSGCPEGGWHCARKPVPARTLAPAASVDFQSMFRTPSGSMSWQGLVDRLVAARSSASVVMTARMNVERGGRLVATQVRHECMFDLPKLQRDIADTRQRRDRIPIIMVASCKYGA